MSTPKFKIGDRVKCRHSEGSDAVDEIVAGREDRDYGWQYKMTDGSGLWWHESHLSLDVPAEPKFKIGDRVKWTDAEGDHRRGVIDATAPNAAAYYIKEAQELRPGLWHESHLSLDVPEPKQFATNREVELGAEIINLHYDIAHLDARLSKEIGAGHRERIAKEEAQRKVMELRGMLKKETYIGSLALGAQKELVEANDKIKRLKSLIGEM